MPAPMAVGRATAGAQITAVPLPLRALAVATVSSPDCLPHLLSHLGAPSASRDGNGATVSVPAAAGAPSAFPICLAHLLERGVFLGWGRGGQLQLRLPEGGVARVRGAAVSVTGADLFVGDRPALAAGDGSRRGASEQGSDDRPGDEMGSSSNSGAAPDSAAPGRAPGGQHPSKRLRATLAPRAGGRGAAARAPGPPLGHLRRLQRRDRLGVAPYEEPQEANGGTSADLASTGPALRTAWGPASSSAQPPRPRELRGPPLRRFSRASWRLYPLGNLRYPRAAPRPAW